MTTKVKPNVAAIKQTMGSVEWSILLLLSVLWGGSFLFISVAVQELPTLTIVFVRVLLAAVALWLFILLTGRALPKGRDIWLAFLGMGLLNNAIPFCLIVFGQHSIASGLASILNASTPLFTVLVAGMLLEDERLSSRKLIGVAIGFLGVAVMIGLDALSGLGTHILAQLAIVGATLSYAFAGVFGRRFKAFGTDPVVVAAGQVTGASIVLLPVALIFDAPWTLPLPSFDVMAAVVALALISTALAYIFYFQLLARAGATNLLLVTFLIPVTAILLGALLLDERLQPIHFVGMALIGVGLAAIDGRLLKFLKS
ncbi:DMT family transporter [uncultured Cohaesibacter sp.]|uniref:DMT family transporter n=1 Tax=uncultured Cohaesibacter sp. TaxID=1002546 RepID=UPI0029C709A4|nr:DMT family transporter [uncultured Cohaesibacter sp.]